MLFSVFAKKIMKKLANLEDTLIQNYQLVVCDLAGKILEVLLYLT